MTAGAAPAAQPLADRAAAVLCDTYRRVPLTLVRGRGARVWSDDGQELLDCVAGIAVNVLGHAHPAVLQALQEQASALIHTSNLYYTLPQVALAERLVASAFPARVFFSNSGAEANEAAIKVARKWGQRHRDGAATIVAMQGAFHGRTLATLAAGGQAHYSDAFRPLPGGFRHVPPGDLPALEAALDREVVAVLLEPIQGEGGIRPLDDGYLAQVRRLCDERQCLLLLDEVQTGMGRTGRMWAHQHAGIVPDVLTCAKGLGGGVPIGATLVGPRADVLEPGDHGSTFGGNPLACAAALAVLRTIETEGLVQRAVVVGARLRQGLEELITPNGPVVEVRGRGLMLGVGLDRPIAPAVAEAARAAGLLVNPVGERTLRLVPPLVLGEQEADLAVARLAQALAAVVTAPPPP